MSVHVTLTPEGEASAGGSASAPPPPPPPGRGPSSPQPPPNRPHWASDTSKQKRCKQCHRQKPLLEFALERPKNREGVCCRECRKRSSRKNTVRRANSAPPTYPAHPPNHHHHPPPPPAGLHHPPNNPLPAGNPTLSAQLASLNFSTHSTTPPGPLGFRAIAPRPMPGNAPHQAYQGPGTNAGHGPILGPAPDQRSSPNLVPDPNQGSGPNLGCRLHGAPGPGQPQPAAGMVLQGGSPSLYFNPSGQVPVNAAPAAPTIAAYFDPTADQRPSGSWPGFPAQFSNLDPSGERPLDDDEDDDDSYRNDHIFSL